MNYTWNDEDRLTSITLPDGHTDTFSYNGLGIRLTKRDPSGNYAYFTDGLTPASSVLSDNYTTFTPGISEYNALGSRFYLADASGNSRGLLDNTGAATDGYNWDAFGTLISRAGNNPTMFAWNESSGYQTDNDDGLTLLGHRYYDKRTGRFLSQDPAGAGRDWYAYCDNDPVNETDPTGLFVTFPGLGQPFNPGDLGQALGQLPDGTYDINSSTNGGKTLTYLYTITLGTGFGRSIGGGGMGGAPGVGMFAEGPAFSDNLGNFIQAVAPHAPKKVVKAATVAGNVAAATGSAKAAEAALKHAAAKRAAANAWRVMENGTARGLVRSLGGEALGALGVAGLGVAAEGIAAWSAGYEVGTAISNAPIGGGQTVNDYLSDRASGFGSWMQQNTTFGH